MIIVLALCFTCTLILNTAVPFNLQSDLLEVDYGDDLQGPCLAE